MRWENLLTIFIVGVGFAFRIRQFLFDRSLWLDEVMAAKNIINKSVLELLTQPLTLNQAAPPFFMFLVKLSVILAGVTDYTLRVIPLLFGLATILLAIPLARLLWKKAPARMTFLCLVAVSPSLVYYSTELKPYGADAFVTVAILAAVFWAAANPDRWQRVLCVGFVGLLGEGLSFPSVFVLGGVGLVMFVDSFLHKRRRVAFVWMAVGLAWIAGFVLEYALLLRAYSGNAILHEFWQTGFPPSFASGLSGWSWYFDAALGLVYQIFLSTTIIPGRTPQAIELWYSPWNIFLTLLVGAGIVVAFFRGKRWTAIFCATMVIAWLAAYVQVYPLSMRLAMYLAPLVFIPAVFCVDALSDSGRWWKSAASLGVSAVLIGAGLGLSLSIAGAPNNHSNMKGALQYISQHNQPNDRLVLGNWENYAFNFYRANYGLEKMPVLMVLQQDMATPLNQIRWKICKDDAIQRVWLVYSEPAAAHREEIMQQFANAFPLMQSWEQGDAIAFLFDVSGVKECPQKAASGVP
jgi:hypothetical protein